MSDHLKDANEVLLLGDGDGRFSTHLLGKFKGIKITSIDASESMLKAAGIRRLKAGIRDEQITSIKEDFLLWSGAGPIFDAIVAQFFFDSFNEEEMEIIAVKIQELLKPSGFLLVSEFAIPERQGWPRVRAQMTLWFLYKVFRILTGLKTQTLVDYETSLIRAGFRVVRKMQRMQGGLKTEIYISP